MAGGEAASARAPRTIPRLYHRFVCRLFGVRVSVVGAPLQGGVLMAANHTGWLDIPILSGVAPVSFVAKTEVGAMALLRHAGAAAAHHLHPPRKDQSGGRPGQYQEALARRRRAGDLSRRHVERRQPGAALPQRAAVSAAELILGEDEGHHVRHAPVQPVSVAYVGLHGMPMGRETRPFFAWYGDMELVPHLWEALENRAHRRDRRVPPGHDHRRGGGAQSACRQMRGPGPGRADPGSGWAPTWRPHRRIGMRRCSRPWARRRTKPRRPREAPRFLAHEVVLARAFAHKRRFDHR